MGSRNAVQTEGRAQGTGREEQRWDLPAEESDWSSDGGSESRRDKKGVAGRGWSLKGLGYRAEECKL